MIDDLKYYKILLNHTFIHGSFIKVSMVYQVRGQLSLHNQLLNTISSDDAHKKLLLDAKHGL